MMQKVKTTFNRKSSSGGKKDESKASASQGQEPAKNGGGKPKNQGKPNQQPPKAASATGRSTGAKSNQSQSALSPGNNSGLQKQKENPLIQFGPILKEFLGSKELVNKSIGMLYVQTVEKFDITLTFQEVLPNGVSTSAPRTLPLEKYLEERSKLLKKKDPASSFKGFVSDLLDRVGVDLTRAKPNVEFKSVERFVMKHLSPVEREIVRLKADEFDRIDTRKIHDLMEPSKTVIEDHYGSFDERTEFLLSQINSDNPMPDKEPPNWVLKGIAGYSKAVLLETLKIQHAPRITMEQQQLIDAMSAQLFGLEEEEESKSSIEPTANVAGTTVGNTHT